MQRTTHQFQLSDLEFDTLYTLAGMPKEVSKSVALRTVLERHKQQIETNQQLEKRLKELKDGTH